MSINLASVINQFAQGNQEDGTLPGPGLSAVETFTYFVAAPLVLFLLISVIVYALTGDRKKAKSKDSVITNIQ